VNRERLDTSALVALLFFCSIYTFPRWADWNQNSRFDLVQAIVDHSTLSIDCCVENTGDYAVFDGHSYSDKAPGLSFLAVPAYALFELVIELPGMQAALHRAAESQALQETLRQSGTGLLLEKLRFALALTFTTALVVSLPSALAGAALYFFLARFTSHRGVRLVVTLTYALATNAFPYSGSFYGHQLAAALLFGAFFLASAGARTIISGDTSVLREKRSRMNMILLGALLGWAVITEYPAILIAAGIAVLAWKNTTSNNDHLWALVGALPALLLCALYDLAIFDTPLPVGYAYSALWQRQHSTGFLSLTVPNAEALWGLTFGSFRGLFFLSPVLLISLPGFVLLWRERTNRDEIALSAWAVLSFLVFNSSSVMWWGGFGIGPRYLVPMLPFLVWPSVALLSRTDRHRGIAVLFAALFAISFASVWALTLAEQQFPPDTIAFPLRDWALPNLVRGNLARNAGMILGLRGWASLLPLVVGVGVIAGVWRWLDRKI